MCFTSKGTSEILVAGWQDTMFVIDVNKGEIVKRVRSPLPLCWLAAGSVLTGRIRSPPTHTAT